MKPQIDLFEPSLFPAPARPPLRLWLAVLALAAAAIAGRIGAASWQLSQAKAAVPPPAAEVAEEADPLAGLRREVAAAEALAARLAARPAIRWDPLAVSAGIFAALPPGVWLQALEVDAAGSATLQAAALDAADIRRVSASLGEVAALRAAPVRVLQSAVAGADDEVAVAGAMRFALALGDATGIPQGPQP